MYEELSIEMSEGDISPDIIQSIVLKNAIDRVPDDKAAVILLDIAGFKQSEISKILGVSRANVWSKKTSAIKLLKTILTSGELTNESST